MLTISELHPCHIIEEAGSRITLTEEAVGPRLFIAPELEDGRVADVSSKSDIYSLGKLLYWLVSGGKIFSREKHREQKWDLRGWDATRRRWNNIYMEHINRLLDSMIVANPEERLFIDQVLVISQDITRLVKKEFTPIAEDISAPCLFCGQGHYQLKARGTQVESLGFTSMGSPDWRIMVCNVCGHVQAFRVDMAEKKEWWGSDASWRY